MPASTSDIITNEGRIPSGSLLRTLADTLLDKYESGQSTDWHGWWAALHTAATVDQKAVRTLAVDIPGAVGDFYRLLVPCQAKGYTGPDNVRLPLAKATLDSWAKANGVTKAGTPSKGKKATEDNPLANLRPKYLNPLAVGAAREYGDVIPDVDRLDRLAILRLVNDAVAAGRVAKVDGEWVVVPKPAPAPAPKPAPTKGGPTK
jgi:hypothetical protein